eukprot:366239-Chlamydomonas_euryale.AAC.32
MQGQIRHGRSTAPTMGAWRENGRCTAHRACSRIRVGHSRHLYPGASPAHSEHAYMLPMLTQILNKPQHEVAVVIFGTSGGIERPGCLAPCMPRNLGGYKWVAFHTRHSLRSLAAHMTHVRTASKFWEAFAIGTNRHGRHSNPRPGRPAFQNCCRACLSIILVGIRA